MRSETIPPSVQPVDPAAGWIRLVVRERRAFRDFCRSTGDDERVAAYQLWIEAHRQMMAAPAPNEAALGHPAHRTFPLKAMAWNTQRCNGLEREQGEPLTYAKLKLPPSCEKRGSPPLRVPDPLGRTRDFFLAVLLVSVRHHAWADSAGGDLSESATSHCKTTT